MSIQPINFSIPNPEELTLFDETLNKLNTKFKAEFDSTFQFSFKGFQLLNDNQSANPLFAINLSGAKKNAFITFALIENTYRHKITNIIYREYQAWGLAILKSNFGHVLIKPESLLEKLMELVNPVEIDFADDKEFSDKFYVLTDDKDKAFAAMNQSFRNAVMEIPGKDFFMEILNNKLIIGNKKMVDPYTAFAFAEFINKVVLL